MYSLAMQLRMNDDVAKDVENALVATRDALEFFRQTLCADGAWA
jgi:hypothetical protein